MDVIFKLVDAGKVGGWVRAGVGALIVWALAKWPALTDLIGDKQTQMEIAVAVSSVAVGAWSHFAKAMASTPAPQVANMAKKTVPVLLGAMLVLAAGLGLSACSTSTANAVISATQTYDNALQNFNNAAAAVNGSIAMTSATVGPYCTAAETAGQNLTTLASPNAKVVTALNTTAAALTTYCNALPTDIQGAVVALTAAAVAAKKAAQGG